MAGRARGVDKYRNVAIKRGADARFLASGALILAVAMGVGRFAYTPILPAMERDAGLTVSIASALAFANLFDC